MVKVDVIWKFQDVWSMKMPQAKHVFDGDGNLSTFKCKMCTKNKLLHNIKIWWISMLNPLKRVLEHFLLMKMTLDCTIVAQVATN